MRDIEAIAKGMVEATRAFVARAEAGFKTRFDEIEAKLAAIPAGPKGEKGDQGGAGVAGQQGERGADGAPGPQGPRGEKGDPGPAGEVGQDGKDGNPGQKGDAGAPGERGADGLRGEPGPAGASVKGDPGQPGEAGEPGARGAEGPRGEVGPAGESVKGEPGKDGRDGQDGQSVHPDTVARMVLEQVQMATAAMPRAKDGEPGRDALSVEVLPGIEESKSYPRGTQAEYRGGEIRAIRNTDPITDGLGKAGWSVIRNGIDEESEETLNEGRTIRRTTVYTSGRELVREIKTSAILYREVWREGDYQRGDVVTWGGSAWHCQKKTTDKPGTSDSWKLMVKEGARGKDADRPGPPAPRDPVRTK